MDSSEGHRVKQTSYTNALKTKRRKTSIMSKSSNWKLGIFGVIALMLILGGFADSALAITASTPAGRIPAGSTNNTILLSLSGIDTTKGPITIAPPTNWSVMQTTTNNTAGFTTGAPTTAVTNIAAPANGIVFNHGSNITLDIIYGDTSVSTAGAAQATPLITSNGTFTVTQFASDTVGAAVDSTTDVPIIISAEGSGTIAPLAQNVLGGQTGVDFAFTYTAAFGALGDNVDSLSGGTFELEIPAGWSDPNGRITFETPDPGTTTDTFLAASLGSFTITGGNPWTVSVNITDMDGGDQIKVNYTNVAVPITAGDFTFTTRVAPIGRPTKQLAGGSPVVTVTNAPAGSGTMNVIAGGRVAASSESNTIVFRYTASGTLSGGALVIEVPAGWTLPQGSPGSAGFTSISNGASASVSFAEELDDTGNGFAAEDINVTINSLTANQTIEITYSGVTAPAALGTHIFNTFVTPTRPVARTVPPVIDLGLKVDPSPDVTVQAGDGAGTISVVDSTGDQLSNAGEAETLVFTFEAQGAMDDGEISLTIDSNWPDPTTANTAVASTGSTGTAVFIGKTITIPIVGLSPPQKVTITYGTPAGNEVGAPGVPETSSFIFKSKGTPTGVLTQVGDPLTIEVKQARDGSGTATISSIPATITAAIPSNQVTVVFTAVGTMNGGKLRLTRPANWPILFKDADNVVHVTATSTTGGVLGGVDVLADTITVNLTSLAANQTVTFTYTGATAQAIAQDGVVFQVESQGDDETTAPANALAVLATQPTVDVDEAADGSGTATLALLSEVGAGAEGTPGTLGESVDIQATLPRTVDVQFAAIGTMKGGQVSVTAPESFATPFLSTDNIVDTAGEFRVLSVANLDATTPIAVSGKTITLNISNTTLQAADTLTIRYRTSTGTATGDFTFNTKSKGSADEGRTLTTLTTALPKIVVTNVPDGSGTAQITVPAADADDANKRKLPVRAENQTIEFVFTAAGPLNGGEVQLEVGDTTAGWAKPGGQIGSNISSEPGFVQVTPKDANGNVKSSSSIGALQFGGPNIFTVTIPIVSLTVSETLTISYSNITVPDTVSLVGYDFLVRVKGSSGGVLLNIADNNTVALRIVATTLEGSGTVEVSPKIITRGETRNYTFTYTALGRIQSFRLDKATSWTDFQNTVSTDPGFVTVSSGTINVTTGAISVTDLTLDSGSQLFITYSNATAPNLSGPTVGAFTASSSATTTPAPISGTGATVYVTANVADATILESGKVVATETDATTPDTQIVPPATVPDNVRLSNDLDGNPVRAASNTRLKFVYRADGFIKDGELEIRAPSGWTLPTTADARGKVTVSWSADPDPTAADDDDPSVIGTGGGAIVVAIPRLELNQTVTVLYGNGAGFEALAPATAVPNGSPFPVLIKASPSGARQPILKNQLVAQNAQVLVNVNNAAPGTGSVAYIGPASVNGGSSANSFTFRYTAAGTMNGGVLQLEIPTSAATPVDWSAPDITDDATVDDPGLVTASVSPGGTLGSLATVGNVINLPITTLGAGGTIDITYGSGAGNEPQVQGAEATGDNAAQFIVRSEGVANEGLVQVGDPIKVDVTKAADGSGTVAIAGAPLTFAAASGGHTLTFTYTAVGDLTGGEIRLFAPSGWSTPQGLRAQAGYASATALGGSVIGNEVFDSSSVVIPIVDMQAGEQVQIVYGDIGGGGAGSGATAANAVTGTDESTFVVHSRASGGAFAEVSQPGVTITNAADGSGSATASVTEVTAGSVDNALSFTFTGVGTMNGGAIRMALPAGWEAPTLGDGGNTSVSTSGSIGTETIDGSGRVVVPITTLGAGGTTTISYTGDAQNTENTAGVQFLVESAGDNNLNFAAINTGASATGSTTSPLISVTYAADGSGTATVDLDNPPGIAAGNPQPAKVASNGETRTYFFTYTAAGDMAGASKISLEVPSDWTPLQADNGDPTVDPGEFTVSDTSTTATFTPELSGNAAIATIDTGGTLAFGETVTFTYKNATAPSVAKVSTFVIKSQGAVTNRSLVAIGSSPTVTTTKTGDGSGAMVVTPTSVRAASSGNNFTFTYTAVQALDSGELRITTPSGWTTAADGIPSSGITSTGNLGTISYDDSNTTAVVRVNNLAAQGTITVPYSNATAQSSAGTATFLTQTRLTQTGTLTAIDNDPTVTVENANDGTGTAVVSGGPVPASSTGNELTFDFTAAGTMDGAAVSVTVPTGWTEPQGTQFQPGYTTASTPSGGSVDSNNLGFDGRTIMVPITTLGPSQTVRIVYGAGSGSSGAQAQTTGGGATFLVQSKGKSDGTLTSIAVQPVVVVTNARDGSGTMAVDPTSVSAGSTATLTFTYSPVGTVNGGAISISVPSGWPGPTSVNTIVQPEPGAQFGSSQFSSGNTVTVPINALTSGQTVRVQYTAAVPAQLGAATFATRSQGLPDSQGGTLVELDAGSPSVTVTGAVAGSGTVNVSAASPVSSGSSGNNITIDYTAVGPIQSGALQVEIPAGWTPREGPITVDSTGTIGTATFATGVVDIPLQSLNANDTVTISYSNSTAQGTAGNAVFVVKSKGSASETLADVTQGSFTVPVSNVADGSGTATISPASVVAGSTNDLELRFTASGSMDNGRISLDIPAGWTVGSVNTSSDGFVEQPTVSATLVTVRINSLSANQAIVVSLNGSLAPSTPESSTFTVKSRGSASGSSTALAAGSPSVNVTQSASTIAFTSAPQNIFKGQVSGAITVETQDGSGSAAASGSDVVANLSSSTATGVFDTSATGAFDGTVTSVTIPAGQTSASVFYKDTTAGTATLTATAVIGGQSQTTTQDITITEEASKLALSSAGSVFEGDPLSITVMTHDANDNAATSASDVTVSLSSSSTTGTFDAATVTIPAGQTSATASYTDTTAGTATITATDTGLTQDTHDVTVNSNITTTPIVSGSPAAVDSPITVTVTGKPGATGSFSIGTIVTDKGLTEDAGTYTGDFTPATGVQEGTFDLVVNIGSSSQTVSGAVTIDTTAPVLSNPTADPTKAKNGDTVTLSVTSSEPGAPVWANVSELDTTQSRVDFVKGTGVGIYTGTVTISADNQADNGDKTITFWAEDAAGNKSEGVTATVDLRNFAEFDLSIPNGTSLIHIPLAVTGVGDESRTLDTVGDLFDALGDNVNFLVTYDTSASKWRSYLGDQSRGTSDDLTLTDDMGIVTLMSSAVTLRLKGNALGADGKANINLAGGTNLIGVPLKDSNVNKVSDLLELPGFSGNVAGGIIVQDPSDGRFKIVDQAGDPGDSDITGGQSFIVTALADGVAEVTGEAWDNVSGASPAPPIAIAGFTANGKTPVLAVQGTVVDEITGLAKDGFRIMIKNLSTGATLDSDNTRGEAADGKYSVTFVDATSSRAARVGDILEITAETADPLLGVQPLRHIVTTDDVKKSLIGVEDLIAYEIPAQTELLHNFPNPFNPETWIPYRLAEDASVTLTIYDITGKAVRSIHVGHQPAAVYESRSKAIYWDGRNNFGERVASGVYFYNLAASEFSGTRKMLILK